MAERAEPGSERRDRLARMYRYEGREARLSGLTLAHCPYFPHIGVPPVDYVSPGENWIAGWREADASEAEKS